MRIIGYGYLPYYGERILIPALSERIERILMDKMNAKYAHNFIIVAGLHK
jgi:hypothetical protein